MPFFTARTCLCVFLLAVSGAVFAAIDKQESQAFYEDAVERFRSRNFPEAEIQLRNALQRNPDNLAARILFGRTLLYTDQPNAAIHEFKRAQAMGGDENLFVVELANAYLKIAQPEEIIDQFKPGLYSPVVAGELFLVLGEAHLQMGDLAAAAEAFEESASRLALDARPVVGRARIALAEGKLVRAEKLLKTAALLGPDNPEVWLLKALKHRDSGEYDRARDAFDRTLSLKPNSVRALVGRAAMWMDLGETVKARADLEKSREFGTATLESIYLEALLLFQEGKSEEARESLRTHANEIEEMRKEARSRLPKVELMLGVVAYFERNHSQAVEHLRRFLSSSPSHRGALRYLAGAYLALKEYDNAIALYQPRASSPAPGDPLALALLAEAYRLKGDYARAEEYIDSAYQMGPALAAVGIRVAMDRLDSGRSDRAVADLEKLVARFPQFVEIQVQLARAYMKSGDVTRASAVTDRLVNALPDDPQVRILTGTVQLAAGNVAAARAHFQHAHEIDPSQMLPRLNLARIDRIEGKTPDAEGRYRQILDEFPGHHIAGIELSRMLLERGDVAAATHFTDAVVKENPDLVDAHRMKLEVMFASNAPPGDMASVVEEALQRFPDDPEAQVMAGRVFRRLGDLKMAGEHFRAAAKGLPVRVGPLFSLANKQFGIGDFEGARETLARAGRAAPDDAKVLVLRASVETQLQSYETASSFISRAESLHGEKASISTVKGDWLIAQGRVATAVDAYQKAFDISPNPSTVATLFRARAANGQVPEALALMSGWIEKNPGDFSSRRLHARLLVRERRWDEARAVYEALMADGLQDPLALNNLAVVYQNLDDKRAVTAARTAYERAPDNPSVIDTYGWVLAENGDPRKGLALLRDAYSRLSTEPVIRYHMGLALSRIEGREGEAAEELEAALALGEKDKTPAPWKDDAIRVLDTISKAN